jgi:protein-L-isoaspartate(D-aspartate) O-methyltransferase
VQQGGSASRLLCQSLLTLLTGFAAPLWGLFGRNGGPSDESDLAAARQRMVEEQIARRGVRDERVLAAMLRVERHRFVSAAQVHAAYGDHPLPVGEGQTISQPYIVALMTEALALQGDERVLEVGTGSGYQTAILAELARDVYSIEILPELARRARAVLEELGYANVHVGVGDGSQGWAEHAPYQAILVTAAPPEVPPALLDQLAEGGRLVIPIGVHAQELELYTKSAEGVRVQSLAPVRFVPLTGGAGYVEE